MMPSDIIARASGRRLAVFELPCSQFDCVAEVYPHVIPNRDPKEILLIVENAFTHREELPQEVAHIVEACHGQFDYLLITCTP